MPLNEDNSVLSVFRGMGYDPSFARKRGTRGKPVSLTDLTDKFLEKLKSRNNDLASVVEKNWDLIIDRKFVGKCAPMNIRLGVLYVSTCNSAIKQELLFMQHTILAGLHKLEGGDKIKKIRFL